MNLRSKIRSAALGVAIGDRLGMPVEMYSPQKIQEVFPETGGRVTTFLQPRNHKFFANDYNGVTDDWNFTAATFEGFIKAEDYRHNTLMRSMIAENTRVYVETKALGCGGTTRKAMDALIAGASWAEAAPSGMGTGNGVSMKIMPVAAARAVATGSKVGVAVDHLPLYKDDEYERFVINYTLMTHAQSAAVSTSLAMAEAYRFCFLTDVPNAFNLPEFVSNVVCASARGMRVLPLTITDNATARLCELINHPLYNTERIIKDFGAGGCYCYHSIPFSLMFFVKNPLSIDTLYDVVSAGGDTDSNGSMVAGLLGALHGESIFPSELVDGLPNRDEVLAVADRFCDKFRLA